jgi:hypothetical protein
MLTQIQKKTLNALFNSMDKSELDETLDMLLEEGFKRDWEINLITPTLESDSSEPKENQR